MVAQDVGAAAVGSATRENELQQKMPRAGEEPWFVPFVVLVAMVLDWRSAITAGAHPNMPVPRRSEKTQLKDS